MLTFAEGLQLLAIQEDYSHKADEVKRENAVG